MTRALCFIFLLFAIELVSARPFFTGHQYNAEPIGFHHPPPRHQDNFYRPVSQSGTFEGFNQEPFSDIYRGVKNHIVHNVGLVAKHARNKAQSLFSEWHNALLPPPINHQHGHGYGSSPTFGGHEFIKSSPILVVHKKQYHHVVPNLGHVPLYPNYYGHFGKKIPPGVAPHGNTFVVPAKLPTTANHPSFSGPAVAPHGNTFDVPVKLPTTANHPSFSGPGVAPHGNTFDVPAKLPTTPQPPSTYGPIVGEPDQVSVASEPDIPQGPSDGPNGDETSLGYGEELETTTISEEVPQDNFQFGGALEPDQPQIDGDGPTVVDPDVPVDAVSEPDSEPPVGSDISGFAFVDDTAPNDETTEQSSPDDLEGSITDPEDDVIPDQGPPREIWGGNNVPETGVVPDQGLTGEIGGDSVPVPIGAPGSFGEQTENPVSDDVSEAATNSDTTETEDGENATEDGDFQFQEEDVNTEGINYDDFVLKESPDRRQAALGVRNKKER